MISEHDVNEYFSNFLVLGRSFSDSISLASQLVEVFFDGVIKFSET
jgi:hypothetical protein